MHDTVDNQTIAAHTANPSSMRPRSYNGMVGLEYYCPSCAQSIQLTNTRLTPIYCPCCQTPLITDADRFRIDYSASLRIHPTVYDVLLEQFRAQSAFLDFRDYVECVVHGKSPVTNKEWLDSKKRSY